MVWRCFEKKQNVPEKPFDSTAFGSVEAAANADADADLIKSLLIIVHLL
jgi:hypothetical protein